MFFIAKLHPNLTEYNDTNYKGSWLSKINKENIINRFYKEKNNIPLCIDHRDIGKFGFVKYNNIVGNVIDLFNNKDGELMIKCKINNEHPSFPEITQGIFKKKEKWGVSVGLINNSDSKSLVHVALTTDPGFANHNTFLFKYSLTEDIINKVIAREYYNENNKNTYATDEFRAKLKSIFVCF